MSTDHIDGEHNAEVIPLRPAAEPAPQPTPPEPVPAAGQPEKWRPIIPEPLQPGNIGTATRQAAKRQAHRTAVHGVRLPWYVFMMSWYALRGAAVLGKRLSVWLHVPNLWHLESQAVAAGRTGHQDAMAAHRERAKRQKGRWNIFAACLAGVLIAVVVAVVFLPWQAWPVLAVVTGVVFARYGKPAGTPLIQHAIISPELEKLTGDIVVRALGALGIAAIDRAIAEGSWQRQMLADPIHQSGPGYLARVVLPYGVTAGEVMDRREKLASGLRRQLGCVWPETTPGAHPGLLSLWVGYQNMSKTKQPAWPLARQGGADLFKPAAFGTDQRNRIVPVTLMFVSVIIGAIPRMGKTFLLRLLGLIAALDVRAELHVYDLKGTGDLSPLEAVAHRYRAGDEPEDIEYALKDMRGLREELRRRTRKIRELPKDVCPENKVTPELASRKALRLHPIVITVDECQVWFEHPKHGGEFEEICTDLVKRGPAVGIVLILATQRPDAKSIPTGISANAVLRLCLKVMGWQENDMVLGTGAHKRGVRATMFSFDDKGITYFSGEGDAPRITRSFYIDAPAAEKIALRARGLRKAAGTLSGYAAGETDSTEAPRDPLSDVLAVFGTDAGLQWQVLADRLAGQFPERWAGATKDAVSAQCLDLGVPSAQVKQGGRNLQGCRRLDVERMVSR